MSDWITDRLPTAEDAVSTNVLIWLCGEVGTRTYYTVAKGTPWQPIPKPAPYVKPKPWTVEWYDGGFVLRFEGDEIIGGNSYLPFLKFEDAEAAQRICDIYNEVMPYEE